MISQKLIAGAMVALVIAPQSAFAARERNSGGGSSPAPQRTERAEAPQRAERAEAPVQRQAPVQRETVRETVRQTVYTPPAPRQAFTPQAPRQVFVTPVQRQAPVQHVQVTEHVNVRVTAPVVRTTEVRTPVVGRPSQQSDQQRAHESAIAEQQNRHNGQFVKGEHNPITHKFETKADAQRFAGESLRSHPIIVRPVARHENVGGRLVEVRKTSRYEIRETRTVYRNMNVNIYYPRARGYYSERVFYWYANPFVNPWYYNFADYGYPTYYYGYWTPAGTYRNANEWMVDELFLLSLQDRSERFGGQDDGLALTSELNAEQRAFIRDLLAQQVKVATDAIRFGVPMNPEVYLQAGRGFMLNIPLNFGGYGGLDGCVLDEGDVIQTTSGIDSANNMRAVILSSKNQYACPVGSAVNVSIANLIGMQNSLATKVETGIQRRQELGL